MNYDASDPAQVKDQKGKAKRMRMREQDDLKAVLSTVEGKRFVWRVLEFCGIHSDSFDTNALQMARKEGKRSIGLFLEVEIGQSCPEKFLEMQLMAAKEKEDA